MMNTKPPINLAANFVDPSLLFDSQSIGEQDHSQSATSVITQLSQIIPHMIVPDTAIDEALMILKRSNQKTKLYVGTDSKLLGIINNFTLVSHKVLMIANRKGLSRSDLSVSDVMTLTSQMPVLTEASIRYASIGDINKTMQQCGAAHIQIINRDNKISGIISASDIAVVLKTPIDIKPKVHSFKDCFDVIHSHTELI